MAIVAKKRPAAGTDGGGAVAAADKLKKPRFEKPAVDGGHKKQFNKPKFSKPGGAGGGGGGPHKFGKSPSSKFGAAKKPFNKFAGKSRAAPDAAATAPVKQDWSKFKKEKKELKLKRKQGKDLFELTVEGKKLYEKLKCKSTKDKDVLAKDLHALLRGGENYRKLVVAHDTARIVQCLLKYSTADIREEISQNLIEKVSDMAISKYAHFCVMRMVKYGSAGIVEKVITALLGKIIKLINNVYGAAILDTIYVSWASAQQKAYMRQEFYGDLYKTSKDASVRQIGDTYKDSPHMKLAILNAVKANLEHIVNKKLVDNSLVHAVLWEYLNVCSAEEREEMRVAYSPYIPSLASTRDGVRASMMFFTDSIVKDRRAIVKTLKEHLIKLCTHEHGHVLILAVINAMDDTKALKKALFDTIFGEIEAIVANEYGRKIIEWFVSPDDKSLFHPATIAFLEETLRSSKKDKSVRRTEILEAIEAPLCEAIAANPAFWLRGGPTGLVTAAILRNVSGGDGLLAKAYGKLAELILDPEWRVDLVEPEGEKLDVTPETVAPAVDGAAATADVKVQKKKKALAKKYISPIDKPKVAEVPKEQTLGVDHAGLHIVLKKILKGDADKLAKSLPTFGAAIAEQLTNETVLAWLPLNRATFLLLVAFENGTVETQTQLKATLAGHVKLLKKQTHAGSKLIVKKFGF